MELSLEDLRNASRFHQNYIAITTIKQRENEQNYELHTPQRINIVSEGNFVFALPKAGCFITVGLD